MSLTLKGDKALKRKLDRMASRRGRNRLVAGPLYDAAEIAFRQAKRRNWGFRSPDNTPYGRRLTGNLRRSVGDEPQRAARRGQHAVERRGRRRRVHRRIDHPLVQELAAVELLQPSDHHWTGPTVTLDSRRPSAPQSTLPSPDWERWTQSDATTCKTACFATAGTVPPTG